MVAARLNDKVFHAIDSILVRVQVAMPISAVQRGGQGSLLTEGRLGQLKRMLARLAEAQEGIAVMGKCLDDEGQHFVW